MTDEVEGSANPVKGGAGLVTLGETMILLSSLEIGDIGAAARTFRVGIGGSESNVAIGMRRLGLPATWFGCIGDDELGRLIRRELRGEDVDVRAALVSAQNGLMMRSRRSGGVVKVQYYRAGSAGAQLGPQHLDDDAIRAAAVLHVTGITIALSDSAAAAVRHAMDTARAASVPISLDINYRAGLWDRASASDTLRQVVRGSDIVFATEYEAGLIVDECAAYDMAVAIAGLGPKEVVVKRGADGAVSYVEGQAFEEPALQVAVVDPVGAGDAFAAGYLSEWMNCADPAARLAAAVSSGCFAVTVPGDWEGMPYLQEREALHPVDPVVR
jgi:2-dehydro-3-deoxygluconokinase